MLRVYKLLGILQSCLRRMFKFYLKENMSSKDMLDFILRDNNIYDYNVYYNEYGKPYLDNGLYFNISHSKNVIVCVISDREVGIDIEYLRYSDSVIRKCFNDKERVVSLNNKEIFTIIWTIKESYVKLLGIGLEYGLNNVDSFSLRDNVIVKKFNDFIVSICMR